MRVILGLVQRLCFAVVLFAAGCHSEVGSDRVSSRRSLSDNESRILVEHLDDFQGQPAIRITGPAATWVFHKQGAALASIFDSDGADWISYRPEGGAEGHFRGFPNLIHPEGDFHPGGENSDLEILYENGEHVGLRAATRDGEWEALWDITAGRAQFTVTKAPRPYWVLYEGTPGGSLDLDHDYYLLPDSPPSPVTESFARDLPGTEWIAFGDDRLGRVLYLVQHHDDDKLDQFYEMQSAMTVFGFGREHRCCGKYLESIPATYTIGFLESDDPRFIGNAVRAIVENPVALSR